MFCISILLSVARVRVVHVVSSIERMARLLKKKKLEEKKVTKKTQFHVTSPEIDRMAREASNENVVPLFLTLGGARDNYCTNVLPETVRYLKTSTSREMEETERRRPDAVVVRLCKFEERIVESTETAAMVIAVINRIVDSRACNVSTHQMEPATAAKILSPVLTRASSPGIVASDAMVLVFNALYTSSAIIPKYREVLVNCYCAALCCMLAKCSKRRRYVMRIDKHRRHTKFQRLFELFCSRNPRRTDPCFDRDFVNHVFHTFVMHHVIYVLDRPLISEVMVPVVLHRAGFMLKVAAEIYGIRACLAPSPPENGDGSLSSSSSSSTSSLQQQEQEHLPRRKQHGTLQHFCHWIVALLRQYKDGSVYWFWAQRLRNPKSNMLRNLVLHCAKNPSHLLLSRESSHLIAVPLVNEFTLAAVTILCNVALHDESYGTTMTRDAKGCFLPCESCQEQAMFANHLASLTDMPFHTCTLVLEQLSKASKWYIKQVRKQIRQRYLRQQQPQITQTSSSHVDPEDVVSSLIGNGCL